MPKHLGKIPEPRPNLTKAERNARRKRIIEYYETTANRSKALTKRHFAKEIPRTSIYEILSKYERRKKEGWTGKRRMPKRTATGPEMIQKYAKLYQMDPMITDLEAGQILNIKNRSSVIRLRKAFRETLKSQNESEEEETPNKEVLDSWCLGENRIESEDVDVEPPPVPVKVKKTGRCHCLACFQQFEEVIPVHRNVDKLTENLKMIFVFKYLLDMTSEEMTEFMRSSFGKRDPRTWVIFCEDCQNLVDQAMSIHKQIQELEKKMKGYKNEITQRIWNTSGLNFKGKHVKGCKYIKYAGLTKKVREMVCNRKRSLPEPEPCNFEEGDKEAEIRAMALIPPEMVVKQEIQDEDEAPVDHFVEFPCDLVKNENDTDSIDSHSEPVSNANVELPSAPSELAGPNFLDELLHRTSVETNPTSNAPFDIERLTNRDSGSAMELNSTISAPMPTVTQGICDVCGVEMRPFAIPMHKLTEHNIVMEGYTAKYCEKEGCKYKTLYDTNFQKHVKMHSENRPFHCSYCGKGFAKREQFYRHEEIHKNAETRPYQCDLCGSSFAVKTYLYLHKRMSHEKRFFPSTNRKRTSERVNIGDP